MKTNKKIVDYRMFNVWFSSAVITEFLQKGWKLYRRPTSNECGVWQAMVKYED